MSENKNQEELKAVLKKYLNNDASPDEQDAINSWYHALGTAQEETSVFKDSASKAEIKNSIKRHLRHQVLGEKDSWFKPLYLKYAAACLLLIGLGTGGYYYTQSKKAGRRELTISSGAGTQKQLTLPDGSEVMLNVDSKLTVSKDFGESDRGVTLVGEAFFKVAKDKTRPFIIRSGTLKTRVVGTSFNINAYPDLEKIKVAVMTGKVRVCAMKDGHSTLLAQDMVKGQTLSFYRETGSYELRTEDTELISSWRTNKLYIDNANISDIAKQLERYYHIKVVYTGKADLKDKYTIRFNNESMNGVLQILSALTKKKFSYENHQITIK